MRRKSDNFLYTFPCSEDAFHPSGKKYRKLKKNWKNEEKFLISATLFIDADLI